MTLMPIDDEDYRCQDPACHHYEINHVNGIGRCIEEKCTCRGFKFRRAVGE